MHLQLCVTASHRGILEQNLPGVRGFGRVRLEDRRHFEYSDDYESHDDAQ